jgi:hypothetical protein
MIRNIKDIPKKTGLLIFILLIQQISLVFSYSTEKTDLITHKDVRASIPLFVESSEFGLKSYSLHSYYDDDLERWKVKKSIAPSNIMTEGIRSEKFLSHFLNSYNKKMDKKRASELAQIYIEEAKNEGVNHDIAFAQMCLETGFLTYNGSVKPIQNNFCGLGATNKFEPGDSFESIRIGVRAHIQHLKAYADHQKINTLLVDKRFKFIKRGSAKTVQSLTGKWATDPDYGDKIDRLLEDLYSI